jgi:hypothetical protein
MRLSYVLFFVFFVVASTALRHVQEGASLRDVIQALVVGAVATAVYAGIERSTK